MRKLADEDRPLLLRLLWGGDNQTKRYELRENETGQIEVCYRPLAIRPAYSNVPILSAILGVKIVFKHAQREITRIDRRHVLNCVRNQ